MSLGSHCILGYVTWTKLVELGNSSLRSLTALRYEVKQHKSGTMTYACNGHWTAHVCVWGVHILSNMITGAFNVETTRSSTFMFHHESHGVSPTPAIYQTKITARALTPGTKEEDQDPPPGPAYSECPTSVRLCEHATLHALNDALWRRPESTPHFPCRLLQRPCSTSHPRQGIKRDGGNFTLFGHHCVGKVRVSLLFLSTLVSAAATLAARAFGRSHTAALFVYHPNVLVTFADVVVACARETLKR